LNISKGVIRSRKSKKDRHHNNQKEMGQTIMYKSLHRKLKIEKHEHYKKTRCTHVIIVTGVLM